MFALEILSPGEFGFLLLIEGDNSEPRAKDRSFAQGSFHRTKGSLNPRQQQISAPNVERRVETHIFLCVLAYHLLVCIERAFLEQSIHTSWETLRRQLSTHQVVTVRLPTTDGRVLTIRRDTRPEQIHRDIYRVLRVSERIVASIKRWTQNSH